MSYIISTACVRIKAPGVAKSVLMQLADIANDDGYAWPSIETLAMRTCWSRRAVIEAINWLEEHGALRRDTSNGRKTAYWITAQSFLGEWYPTPENQCASRTGAPAARVRQLHPTSAAGAPNQCANSTLITKNHQEHQIPPNPPTGGAAGFAEFIAGYPRQVDHGKAQAAWDKLAPDAQLQGEIAQAVQAWIRSPEWQRDGGRFVPKPSNWLRGKRWRDVPGMAEPPAPPAPPPPPPKPTLTPAQLAANKARAQQAAALARATLGGAGAGAHVVEGVAA